MWNRQKTLMSQLQKSTADTSRVNILLKLSHYYLYREYYLYKTGSPTTQMDSASYFAKKALFLSNKLKYEYGKNQANLLIGDTYIRKDQIPSAVNLLGTLKDSTRFSMLVILGRHYLFHLDRSPKDLKNSLYYLEQSNKITEIQANSRLQAERMHVKAMCLFITEGFQQSKKQYLKTINEVDLPGNEEKTALLWHELATLIPIREKTGLTKLNCFENMFALYKKSGNIERQAWVLKTIADIHLVSGKPDLAETELLQVLDLYKSIAYKDLHYIYDLLSVTYRYKGDSGKCISYGLKAIESMEAANDSTSALTFYSRLAHMYKELGQPDKSIEWYLKIFDNQHFKSTDNLYKFREARLFAKELINLKKDKEALSYILDIKAKYKPVGIYSKACLISSLAYCYHSMQQGKKAEKYYLELIKLSGEMEQGNEITANIDSEIGEYFINKRQYDKALPYLQKALDYSETTNKLSFTKDIHLMFFNAYSGLKNFNSAIKHLLKHQQLKDSMFNETKNWQIAELQVQFETAKKQKDIELLNKQNQLQYIRIEETKKLRNITLAIAILLLIIVGLLYNRYLIKQRTNRKLEANKKELDQKNFYLENLNTKQDKLLKEKEWLVKEVHHRVKNNLQMVTSLLNSQSLYLKDNEAKMALKDSLRRMQAMSMIHQKLYLDENVSIIAMPEYVNELVDYLHESFDNENQIIFKKDIEAIDLDVSQAIPLGLIITESVVNAIKYAFLENQKGIIEISLYKEANDLILKISDNGIGLPDFDNKTDTNSLGLSLIKGLAKQLKGSFSIENNNGVHIIIKFMPQNI
ncbi:sensor histidine kinase [Flavobacterium ajazii]|uniref:sensor histidine kinase n=1 Tax=Flavobacterium ajazii TaxID=2692318 RepID=UPI0013D5B214|nr:sensor histidine kinase [Flavobacterium ajazii]